MAQLRARFRSPDVLIPAAGESQRFRDVGYVGPKGMLPIDHGGHVLPMLQHVINSVSGMLGPVRVGVQAAHAAAFTGLVHNGKAVHIIPLPPTSGQAETVARLAAGPDRPALILNCDGLVTYPVGLFCQQARTTQTAVLVAVMPVPTPRPVTYSYVDSFPQFTQCVEKNPVSPWAVVGLYYVRSTRALVAAYLEQERLGLTQRGEFYLSTTLSLMGGGKLALAIGADQYLNWGTPADAAPYIPAHLRRGA